jgi:predicted metal-dependent hydrolase
MPEHIQLGEIPAEVFRKKIKNIHLSVNPPDGHVRISCPSRYTSEKIRAYALTKLVWIKQQQRKLREQPRESAHQYTDKESHYLWGKRHLLKVVETDGTPRVELKALKMVLHVRAGSTLQRRAEIVEEWYRERLKKAIPRLITKWEPALGVEVKGFFVQRMKTKWGSCSSSKHTIRLNSELARKPRKCLEYLVVHEMLHILEPSHNARFRTMLDKHLPNWQNRKKTLNSLPVRHEKWGY